jgi:dipeptidyl aminopeptidase/acylaminoacyl peptidase
MSLLVPSRRRFVGATLLALGAFALPPVALDAQPATNGGAPAAAGTLATDEAIAAERYIAPPETLARLVTAPRERNFTFGTPNPGSRQWFVRSLSDGLPSLAAMAKPYHNLGGFQVDRAGHRSRGLTTRSSAGLELRNAATGKVVTVSVPAGARVGPTAWSPDGTTLAFMALFDDATHIWLADPATGRSRPLTRTPLLATHVTNFEWTADSRSIVAVLLPAGRGAEPAAPAVATEPIVRVNEQNKLKTRTYASLLTTPHDKALLTYYSRGQLAVIDVRSRAVRTVGEPMLIRALSASPDGAHFRVTTLDEPFSYVLPVASFGQTESVLDGNGRALAQLSKRPLREGEDPDAPPTPPTPAARLAADTARRNLQWHPTAPGLLYAQVAPARATARAAGDSTRPAPRAATDSAATPRPANGAARTDRLVHWLPPFDSTSARTLYETTNRIAAARFSDDGRILFVSETGAGGTTEVAVLLDEPGRKYTLLAPRRGARDSAGADSAARPAPPAAGGRGAGAAGTPTLVTTPGRRGAPSVLVSRDGQAVYLQGSTTDTASDRAGRVWLDRVVIRTGERSRLYESSGELTESIAAILDDDASTLIVNRESSTTPPQSFLVTVANREARQLTQNTDLFPTLTAAKRRTVVARRADGYTFNVRVTLPADYVDGTRLPALFWFYPREYQNQEAYDRSAGGGGGNRRFGTFGPRSMAFLTTVGYAVVEPDAPIFASDGLQPNDNYVADLRNNLAATIDALDTLQIIDRHRLGIGGHSYGAFSAVNAMVHTPFFKAGIAGDGAYNRTLTPNGFQSERRDLWQGRETYLAMSPFLYADKLNGALLLYHSTDDQNVGTAPINSERLFHALQGLGKNVSLYMYPYEDHGPIAKETVLDQWARWVAWLDKYVKGDGDRKKAAVTTMEDAP